MKTKLPLQESIESQRPEKVGTPVVCSAKKSLLGKRSRIESGDSRSDGELDIYASFEPTRRLLTPVPEKVTFFGVRELPEFARTLTFERLRGKADPETLDAFAQPVSPVALQRSKSDASFRKMLSFPDGLGADLALHEVSDV